MDLSHQRRKGHDLKMVARQYLPSGHPLKGYDEMFLFLKTRLIVLPAVKMGQLEREPNQWNLVEGCVEYCVFLQVCSMDIHG